MSLKSKEKAAKKREHLKQFALQEQRKLELRSESLKTVTAGFGRTIRTKEIEDNWHASKMPKYPKQQLVNRPEDRWKLDKQKSMQILSKEMQERERIAKEKFKELQSRIGPVFNKGPLQVLTDTDLAAERRGELRRRS